MSKPLAEQLRPETLDEVIGQKHLLGKGRPLRMLVESGKIKSMIFWGPPGCGKTTVARIIAQHVDAYFISYSAISGSIKEVRQILEEAAKDKGFFQKDTILFVDEIHRFNKAQQDAFLPAVEDGTIILIGATTENPGFYVNAPLVSRSQVYQFQELSNEELFEIVEKTSNSFPKHKFSHDAKEHIVKSAAGDARAAINYTELAATLTTKVTLQTVEQAIQVRSVRYDKSGDDHYDVISAFIKSMRGGEVDATLHYLARMIRAGEDPMFIARRMVIFASEDVGIATPTALVLATSAMQAVKMIGMPESQIILAQVATYLARAPKSIASYKGFNKALADLDQVGEISVPKHLRNETSKITTELGYGKGHERYPWLVAKKTGKKPKQEYLPKNLEGKQYFDPELSEN